MGETTMWESLSNVIPKGLSVPVIAAAAILIAVGLAKIHIFDVWERRGARAGKIAELIAAGVIESVQLVRRQWSNNLPYERSVFHSVIVSGRGWKFQLDKGIPQEIPFEVRTAFESDTLRVPMTCKEAAKVLDYLPKHGGIMARPSSDSVTDVRTFTAAMV